MSIRNDNLIGEMLRAMDFASSQYSTDTEARLQAVASFALHLICSESSDREEARLWAQAFSDNISSCYREIVENGRVPWSRVRAH